MNKPHPEVAPTSTLGAGQTRQISPINYTNPDVIHDLPERAPKVRRRKVVNNSAPGQFRAAARSAPLPTRSADKHPPRVLRGKPAVAAVSDQKSERTMPREGLRIVSTQVSANAAGRHQQHNNTPMSSEPAYQYFVGVDWAKDHHDIVVLDAAGQCLGEFTVPHSAAGWRELAERLSPYKNIALCVESGHWLTIEQLLNLPVVIYVVPARSAAAYRLRKAPSGAKSDRFDAWSLAIALRSEHADWTPMQQPDELTHRLRLLCRDQVALIEQRTCLINQLQAALREYYPAALEVFDTWTVPSAWAFIERFPDPETLARAGRRSWAKFLHTHRLARASVYEKRMEILAGASQLVGSSGVAQAKRMLALSLVKMLRCLSQQIAAYQQEINTLFAQHPDHHIFASLPGGGIKLAPRLLAEIGADRSIFANAQSLQCYAGTAPISFQSGQIHRVQVRHACNRHLRAAIHLWVNQTHLRCPWANVYYRALRERGKSHATALRCLGQRWLKILFRMWQNRTTYAPDLHASNQLKHGSWLLKLQPK